MNPRVQNAEGVVVVAGEYDKCRVRQSLQLKPGEDSVFGRGVAQNLGMTDEQDKALFALNQAPSSLSSSLEQANGVWCTNWNAFSVFKNQLPELDRDSYSSPLESAAEFAAPGFVPYKARSLPQHLGCGGKDATGL